MLTGDVPTPIRERRPARRSGARAPRAARPGLSASRRRIAAALSHRGVRERLVLSLLLYERLEAIEVADALGISVRQVERTYASLIAGLRRSLAQPATRTRSRANGATARLRRAA